MSDNLPDYHDHEVHSEYGVLMPYMREDYEISQWFTDYKKAVRQAHLWPNTKLRHRYVTTSTPAYLPPTNTIIYGNGGAGGNSHPGQSTQTFPGGGGGAGGGVVHHPTGYTIDDLRELQRGIERQMKYSKAKEFAQSHDGKPYAHQKPKPRKKAHEIIKAERDRIFKEYGIK